MVLRGQLFFQELFFCRTDLCLQGITYKKPVSYGGFCLSVVMLLN